MNAVGESKIIILPVLCCSYSNRIQEYLAVHGISSYRGNLESPAGGELVTRPDIGGSPGILVDGSSVYAIELLIQPGWRVDWIKGHNTFTGAVD
jgi:hypothetical protein